MRIGDIKESIEITREWFESDKILGRVYLRTESKIKDVLNAANTTVDQIDRVLLVGGSSRIPYIENRVKNFIGKTPSKEVNPSKAVAIGAAIYSSLIHKNNFVDVCSHSIGVVVLNNDTYEKENEIVIPRNSKLPIVKEKRFETAGSNQSRLVMTVTEGEYRELSDVRIIGEFTVEFPRNVPLRSTIIVRIGLNQNQFVKVEVSLPNINFSKVCEIKRCANMDEESLINATGMLRSIAVN